jgi:methylthioribulose-1-phosphate dehydratase
LSDTGPDAEDDLPDEGDVPSAAAEAIVAAGRRMDQRGWVPATAGNISVRLAPNRLAITRSGVHKGLLAADDVIAVGLDGLPLTSWGRPSAETLLHCQLYRLFPHVGAVVHGHSVPATVLSMLLPGPALTLAGYEVLKAFQGQTTHDTAVDLPLVDNDQDIARLAGVVEPLLPHSPAGYLIRGHGTYVWGPDMDVALARFEALEFLLACELERRRISA